MGWIGALLGAFFNALFSAINNWLSGQQAHADAVTVGEKTQQAANDQAAINTAKAEGQAQTDAPKTVEQTEAALDKGTF